MLNHRLKLIIASTVLGTIVIAPKTLAQTNFPFVGTITASCAFDAAPSQGTLVQKTTTVNNDTLSSLLVFGGMPSTATLTCNTPGSNVTIAAPAPANPLAIGLTSVPAGTFANAQGFSFVGSVLGSVNIFSNGVDTAMVGIVNSVLYTVHMEFQATSTIPAGTYAFNVPLTATPN